MKKWVTLMVAFNIFDAVSTIYVVSKAIGEEFNPLVQYLYGFHPVIWLLVKFSLVVIGSSTVLNEAKLSQATRNTFIAVTAFYGALSLYQLIVLILWMVK